MKLSVGEIIHLAERQVGDERIRQDEKWGEQNHTVEGWLPIFLEELGEFCRARLENKPAEMHAELVQLAAVAMAMVECSIRNRWAEEKKEAA